jgi:hypothetical protein
VLADVGIDLSTDMLAELVVDLRALRHAGSSLIDFLYISQVELTMPVEAQQAP